MTLGVLTPYRRYGVGKKMLDWVIEKAKSLHDVNGIFLHVQTTSMKIVNLKSACFSPFFVAFFKSWIRAMNVHIIILRDPLGIGRE